MQITSEMKRDFDTALNEATVHGVEFNRKQRTVGCTLGLVTMNADGSIPDDNRLLFILKPVGRVAASLIYARKDSGAENIMKFEPEKLLEKVSEFKCQSVYGWDFINSGEEPFAKWKDKLSLDYKYSDKIGFTNTLDLFQEGYGESSIDIRIWFDEIEIFTPLYNPVTIEAFLSNGKRGWDAIFQDNKKMMNKYGIVRAAPENSEKLSEIAREKDEEEKRARRENK